MVGRVALDRWGTVCYNLTRRREPGYSAGCTFCWWTGAGLNPRRCPRCLTWHGCQCRTPPLPRFAGWLGIFVGLCPACAYQTRCVSLTVDGRGLGYRQEASAAPRSKSQAIPGMTNTLEGRQASGRLQESPARPSELIGERGGSP